MGRLEAEVRRWIEQDPDPACRRALERLLAEGARAELAERFAGRLEFGTAGLRGLIGAGPMRMNRAVIRGVTAALAAYLKSRKEDAPSRGVVVGYDCRPTSREFAREAAEVLSGAGFAVYEFPEMVPTPVLAFAVRDLGAAAGIMITASHNPPEYNGYKVYWGNGAQILPHHSEGIRAAMDRAGLGDAQASPATELIGPVHTPGRGVESRYLESIRRLALHPEVSREIEIVYTPLHGIGGRLALAALAELGFRRIATVERQFQPDGRFPTARIPNPEETEVLAPALALAAERHADLVLAHDPDADRLAVAVPNAWGRHVPLSGDQIGILLAWYLLTEREGGSGRLALTSIVSSSLLGVMARHLGIRYAETLTGFKWIADCAMALEAREAVETVIGYEEALGYMIGTAVRDKDGLSAAAVFAELSAFCRSGNMTVFDYLERIYRRFGLYRNEHRSLELRGGEGAARIRALMQRARRAPPAALAGVAVTAVRDYLRGVRISGADEAPLQPPSSDVLIFELEGGARIAMRPSGTEPKLKFYFEVREEVSPEEPIARTESRAAARMNRLIDAWNHFLLQD